MSDNATAGFTLIEMLVAVVVLSIALGASLEALSGFSATQARLQERYCAHLVAWKDATGFYLSEGNELQAGYSEQCGVDWEVSESEVKIVNSSDNETSEDDDEDEPALPITITSRLLQVYSPLATEEKGKASAELRLLRIRISL